jgi:hypothetical protein
MAEIVAAGGRETRVARNTGIDRGFLRSAQSSPGHTEAGAFGTID